MLPIFCFVSLIKIIQIKENNIHIELLNEWFKNKQPFTNKEILELYQTRDPQIKKGTVGWRIYELVKRGVIKRVGRGKYILGYGAEFTPGLNPSLKKLHKKLSKQFPYLDICLWETSVLNEFMWHQPGQYYMLVEVEEDAKDSVFYFMKENNLTVFLDPTEDLLNKYITGEKEVWIVKTLITETPVRKHENIITATLEKILVDIFCDAQIFSAQQGYEMFTIFKEAFEKYAVSENKMLRYANRRRKKNELNGYLLRVPKYRQQN